VTALDHVRRSAVSLMDAHLGRGTWSFDFDHAKTRAGQCDFGRHRITVSRHIALRSTDDEVHQILLHEVAHAMVGARAGHGPRWRSAAAAIGYVGTRLHDGPIASELAPWVGTCPAGHEHFRYRTPNRPMACARCSRRYDPRHAITWQRREPERAA